MRQRIFSSLLKIKVGIKNDMEILKELRKITKAVFRVDANTGWTVDEAIKKLNIMEELGVELVNKLLISRRQYWKRC